MKRSRSVLSVAGTGDERPRETPEPGRANMLGADLRRPRRRLSTGPGLGWAEPEPLDPGVPLPPRPTTLPLLIPPRISITKADRLLTSCGEGNGNPLQYSAWKIPWTEEPGGLQSMRSLRVRHS